MLKWIRNIGPGTLVAAAFIGPGTVTVCTQAGARFGYSLLWAMGISITATIVLQEMAARIGLITQKGLAAIIQEQIQHPILRKLLIGLILGAIVVGNAAYEAGNISGAALGMNLWGTHYASFYPLVIGSIAGGLLYLGNYKILERSLIALVVFMSAAFLLTAFSTQPHFSEIMQGMFVPKLPENSLLVVIGLIGTTVVPYNLFLHAALVKERWQGKDDLKHVRKDTILSLLLGGLVSMSIIIAAAATPQANIANGLDLAESLEPLMGPYAQYFLGIGLCAAGITSAITAPLAAAYVARSCLGWKNSLKDPKFRTVWATILVLGVLVSSWGLKPIKVITFAQVANGLLLPIIAVLIIWIVNKTSLLGRYKNTAWQNGIAVAIVLITILLGVKGILRVF